MIVVYHNPRCSKSRACLSFLETSKHDFQMIKYMDEPLSEAKLKKILQLLKIAPIDLIRKNERIWKSDFKGKEHSDEELINAMLKYPSLMERPIVINGNKAVIGRPAEKVLDIL